MLAIALVLLSGPPEGTYFVPVRDLAVEKPVSTDADPTSTVTPSSSSSLEFDPSQRDTQWLSAAPVDDDIVRFRFEDQRYLDVGILTHASRRKDGLHGVGFRLRGRFIWPIQVRAGRVEPTALHTWLGPARRKQELIDVVVTAIDAHLLATVSDSTSGRVLAQASMAIAPLDDRGQLALFVPDDGREPYPALRPTILREISSAPLCRGSKAATDAPPPIVATVAASDRALGRAVVLERGIGDGKVIKTDPQRLRALRCAGVAIADLQTDLPWKYIDIGYLRAIGAPPSSKLGAHFKDNEHVGALLAAWAKRYPDRTRLEKIGVSHQGRPIWALAVADTISEASARPTLLLNGSHHGDELLSVDVVLDAAQRLLDERKNTRIERRVLKEAVVWFVPLVNPDGNFAFLNDSTRAGRKNGRDLDGDGKRGLQEGVDLNRNYPFSWDAGCDVECARAKPRSRKYRGPTPASEPETQAMMKLAAREKFAASLSFHMGTVAVLFPYTVEGVAQPEPNVAEQLAVRVAAVLGKHPNGEIFEAKRNIYNVQGTDQDWFRHEHGTQALLVEMYGWPPPIAPKSRRDVLQALRPAWWTLAATVLEGASIRGRVVDQTGVPVPAVVEVSDIEYHAGEQWSARARDGTFFRLLPGPGRYTVEARFEGASARATVTVGSGPVDVELVLSESLLGQ